MIVVPPIQISDASLTSTNVLEPHAPADYGVSTTYGLGGFATDPVTKLVYQSLQPGNTGNTPATSPLWWEVIGYKEEVWASGTTYAASTDALPVYRVIGHRIYESLQGSNTGNNPYTSPAYWQDIGPTLRYAMFDTLRSTASAAASPLVVTLTPGKRVDTLAVLGVSADTVRVQMTVGGSTVYDQTAALIVRDAFNWYDWFFKSFSLSYQNLFQNLPPYTTGVITVTFTKAGDAASCGALCLGTALDLGITQPSPVNDAQNFSTVEPDEFGNSVLIQRRSIPKTSQTVLAESKKLNDILAVRDLLNAVPAVWAGLTDNASDYFPSLLILGVYTKFSITLMKPNKATLGLELREV